MKANCSFRACPYGESLVGPPRLCFYHGKLSLGLMDPSDHAIRMIVGLRRRHLGIVRIEGLSTADIVSDQQMELAFTLKTLGAPMPIIRRALQRAS